MPPRTMPTGLDTARLTAPAKTHQGERASAQGRAVDRRRAQRDHAEQAGGEGEQARPRLERKYAPGAGNGEGYGPDSERDRGYVEAQPEKLTAEAPRLRHAPGREQDGNAPIDQLRPAEVEDQRILGERDHRGVLAEPRRSEQRRQHEAHERVHDRHRRHHRVERHVVEIAAPRGTARLGSDVP